jgi:hypothetical protein
VFFKGALGVDGGEFQFFLEIKMNIHEQFLSSLRHIGSKLRGLESGKSHVNLFSLLCRRLAHFSLNSKLLDLSSRKIKQWFKGFSLCIDAGKYREITEVFVRGVSE